MGNYSAWEGPYNNCDCCQVSTITCLPVTIVTTKGKVLGEAQAGEQFKVGDSKVYNSDNTYNTNIPAEGELELPDITHTDSDGSLVTTPAQTPFVCTVGVGPDAIVELYNTVPTLLSTTNAPSGVTVPIAAPDSDITVNSTPFFSVPSNETENIDIIDFNNNILPIVNQTANQVEVEVYALNAIYQIFNTTPTLITNGVIASGATKTITLPDTNWEVQVDGVTVDTGSMATLENNTLEIYL